MTVAFTSFRTDQLVKILGKYIPYGSYIKTNVLTAFSGIPAAKSNEVLNRIMAYRDLLGIDHAKLLRGDEYSTVQVFWHQMGKDTLVRVRNEVKFNTVAANYFIEGSPFTLATTDDSNFAELVSVSEVSLHPLTYLRA